jgi:hypothetical protein
MGDSDGFTHSNVAVISKTLHAPLSGNINNIDYADGGHAWTAYPGSAVGFSAVGFSAGRVTNATKASFIVCTTDAGKISLCLNRATFVASVRIPDGAVVETVKANNTVVYAF